MALRSRARCTPIGCSRHNGRSKVTAVSVSVDDGHAPGVVGVRLQDFMLGGDDVRRAAQDRSDLRVVRFQDRQEFVTQTIAKVSGVGVGRIDARLKIVLRAILFNGRARSLEERTNKIDFGLLIVEC